MTFEWITDSIAKVQDLSSSLRLPIVIETFPPIEISMIDDFEDKIGLPFSPSHRDFFQVTNGLNIDYTYVAEDLPGVFSAGGNQIWITPLQQILDKTEHEKKWRDEAISDGDRPGDVWKNLIICAQLGDGQHIVLDPDNSSDSGEYSVCYASHEFWPAYWRRHRVIAKSFEEWLKTMFDSIVLRKEIPEYWDCRPFIPLISPTPLLALGAELYDWTTIDTAGGQSM